MSPRSSHDETRKGANAGSGTAERAAGGDRLPRVRSRELLRDGEQLIIEHAGREYRLRVTSNGKLILTA